MPSPKMPTVPQMILPFPVAIQRRTVEPRLEAALGILVITVAALVAACQLPPARDSSPAGPQQRPAQASALPGAGDLTFGGNAGEVLVGLILRPGKPGPNDVLLYLLPLEGEGSASAVDAKLTVNGDPVELRPCAPTCRSKELVLQGGERIEVHVPGPKGGTASFLLPDLPAPDGAGLLEQMQERMHLLKTFRMGEVLGPAEPPIRTVYAFQAPDRMQMEVSTGFQTVWVGGTRYLRERPDQPWRREASSATIDVPRFIWDGAGSPQFSAPRILGVATLEGVQTQVVSFFEQVGTTPVWFRLWVDARGFVRQAEMRAQGHFMDQRYYDFDTPFTIEPPAN